MANGFMGGIISRDDSVGGNAPGNRLVLVNALGNRLAKGGFLVSAEAAAPAEAAATCRLNALIVTGDRGSGMSGNGLVFANL
jgi:hypothetical protein